MSESGDHLRGDEVAVIPVDPDRGLALVLGSQVLDAESWQIPKGMIDTAISVGGLFGGAVAARGLLDGSLVRLTPQTVARLKEGAYFSTDAEGFALGTLREAGKRGFTDQVRFIEGAADPVAAGLLLQTMAVQMQLHQIQETLEEINEKLDTLLKSDQFGILAEVIATGQAVQELNDKVWAGHALTGADEIKLREYEDRVRRHLSEAELWLRELNALLQLEDPTLKSQYEALDGALRREPVAFWLRVFIVSHVSLAEIRKLRLLRAAAEEPDYARELNEALQDQLHASAAAVQSLCSDVDRYLRRSDIARGFEELSLRRKAKVRRLRRQLWDVDEQLKASLETTKGMYEAVPTVEAIEIPAALDRRAVEPWVVRDTLYDAAVKAADVGTEALTTTADRGVRALIGQTEKRRDARKAEVFELPDSD